MKTQLLVLFLFFSLSIKSTSNPEGQGSQQRVVQELQIAVDNVIKKIGEMGDGIGVLGSKVKMLRDSFEEILPQEANQPSSQVESNLGSN